MVKKTNKRITITLNKVVVEELEKRLNPQQITFTEYITSLILKDLIRKEV